MNRRLVGVVLMLGVATGVATACSGSSESSGSAAMPYQTEATDSGAESGADSDAGAPKATEQGEKPGAVGERDVKQPGVDRTLVRTANLELASDGVRETVDKARGLATTEGGYTGREEVRETYATLTLHIPSDRFDQALDGLSKLGEVVSRQQTAEDVTEEVVDLDSRITTQRASLDRVRTLLAKATTVDEIVRIEEEVTTREADLESLLQRRQALAGQVAMSTVTVTVNKSNAPPVVQQESRGFVTGLTDGWGAFLDAGAGTLQVVGAMLPFLVVIAVPVVFVIRLLRRRRTAVTSSSN